MKHFERSISNKADGNINSDRQETDAVNRDEGHQAPEDHEQHAEVKISDIKVGNRFRKDPGNIDDLVESIRKNSLLCPVTVTKDYLLIDGLRRIEACKKSNIPVIPVHIVDLPIKENGEIDANLIRKDFSIEEQVAIKKYRESIEPNLQGQRNDLELSTIMTVTTSNYFMAILEMFVEERFQMILLT